MGRGSSQSSELLTIYICSHQPAQLSILMESVNELPGQNVLEWAVVRVL